jgi:hypothetical protein
MNTIMTIAYNANQIAALGQAREEESAHEPKVRLIYDIDNTELHLLDGVQQRLEVVHPEHKENIYNHAEQIIAAQKRVEDAVRLYEDRIYKRPPMDIA